ncbi:glycerol-3-phosphate acyltransferase PlsY [Hyphomicrobium denitrificans 1NES1]|uniref:Glycerol-3-phosphate acyltransferase n=1 Tax=Hyphomicrobium denitrificans 1NES1 TaxID=670307 RepID=N0B6Q9_9HYPH|nr:glycerol-3-phosphate 1-O-acyltransferase PlsY [Hyphomicrobium denitrificans]AGK58708.1 glycerol-3-phosphate acyltransferase PlsY [Hyphomicrobium denitrificans 1NES1]
MDSSSPPELLIAFGLGYLLGAIPFGLLLTHLAGLGDVRQIGSGNIGATNVLRTGHRGLAAATLLLDAAKGAAAVLIANYCFGQTAAAIAGLGALLGHIFPVWLKFKGGKGVATFLGVLSAMAWEVAAIFAIVWLAVAAVTRISSLSAMVATVAVPIGAWVLGYNQVAAVSVLMAAIILIKHRGNIRRLLAGEEPKIGAKA